MTTIKRWQQIKELFHEARDQPANQRADYIARACRTDAELQSQVETLLALEDKAASFIEPPTAGDLGIPDISTPGQQIGKYTIVRVIAAGGMGTVYEALQDDPKRTVALKLLRPGLASESALRRFQYEARILARLRHPGIAQIYEAGMQERGSSGVPYFAMEFIPDAKPLIEYADDNGLSIETRLGLFLKVCQAVHHGHQKSVIHRDIKPSNILIDGEGEPKVIDFGVALATDSDLAPTTVLTGVGQILGTLQYMSPEQARGDTEAIDVRSDVFSLGVVLYELLTGQRPYEVNSLMPHEAIRTICEQPPPKPSTISRKLRGDIDTIVLKLLEKDPHRRYQSVDDLAQDITRHLTRQPIQARPPSATYQFRKFISRYRAISSLASLLILVLAAFAIVASVQAQRLQRERNEAEAVTQFLSDMFAAVDPAMEGKDVTVREVLDQAAEAIGDTLKLQPLVEARLRTTIGKSYRTLGLYDAAQPQLERALQLRRDHLGESHNDTLETMNILAVLYGKQGNYEKSQTTCRRVLELRRRVSGEEHPETLRAKHNLAYLHDVLGQEHRAEELLLELLGERQRVLGLDHPDTLITLNALGALYARQQRFDRAIPLLREVVELRRQKLGAEHPYTLNTINNLAFAYNNQGRPDEAEPLFKSVLETRRQRLGEKHPDTLASKTNLAAVYNKQQRFAEAEQLLKAALPDARITLDENHTLTGVVLMRYGVCLTGLKHYEQAEKSLLESYSILGSKLSPEHRRIQAVRSALVDLYEASGKPDQAGEFRTPMPDKAPTPPAGQPGRKQ